MSEQRERSGAFKSAIVEASIEALNARSQVREELPDPSGHTLRRAVKAHANYQDMLKKYSDERILKRPWGERLPFNPDRVLSETVRVEQPVDCSNPDAVEIDVVQAATQIDPQDVLELGEELEAIAGELGFAAEVKSSREKFHIASPDEDHPEPVKDNVTKPGN